MSWRNFPVCVTLWEVPLFANSNKSVECIPFNASSSWQ